MFISIWLIYRGFFFQKESNIPKLVTVHLLIARNARTVFLSLSQVRITLFTTKPITVTGLEEIEHETAAEFKCRSLH